MFADGGYVVEPDSVGIWATDVQTAATRLILNQAITSIDLSADGSMIAFGAGAQVFRASLSGDSLLMGTVSQLTTMGRNFFPAWSASGLEIAFDNTDCDVPSAPDACGVLVMNNDGSNVRLVARGRTPDWNPQDTEIAYIGVGGDLYSIPYPGPGTATLILAIANDISYPRYSCDGSTIAFVVFRDGTERIWLVDSDGGNPRELVAGSWPAWSPGDEAIAFARPSPSDPRDNGTLWAINLSDFSVSRLTHGVNNN